MFGKNSDTRENVRNRGYIVKSKSAQQIEARRKKNKNKSSHVTKCWLKLNAPKSKTKAPLIDK